jgi:hypothetical protein
MGAHIGMGLSLKVPSFLAMGVPVVVVRASVMESLVNDGEVLMFADGDHQDFADYLVRLHEDPEFGDQMSGRARRFTQGYVWEGEFGGYLQLLGRLTGRELPPVAAAQRSNPPENCGKAAAAESWSHDGVASSIAAP